jgi:hypothetical protein
MEMNIFIITALCFAMGFLIRMKLTDNKKIKNDQRLIESQKELIIYQRGLIKQQEILIQKHKTLQKINFDFSVN